MKMLSAAGAAVIAALLGFSLLASDPDLPQNSSPPQNSDPSATPASGAGQPGILSVKQADKLFVDGNYQEAFDQFKRIATSSTADANDAAHSLVQAVNALNQLGKPEEFDALVNEVLAAYAGNPILINQASILYRTVPHSGSRIDNVFQRGNRRNRGDFVSSDERDRARSIQLAWQAVQASDPNAPVERKGVHKPLSAEVRADMFLNLAEALEWARQGDAAWQWQDLTDLTTLPDFAANNVRYGRFGWRPQRESAGSPVDAEGNPVYYHVPASFEAAKSDGERWRWALEQVSSVSVARAGRAELRWANYLQSQFGVATLQSWSGYQPLMQKQQTTDEKGQPAEPGPFALHTLTDQETIARLATGVRRFELPAEFNYLAILKKTAARDNYYALQARQQLASEYMNRRQFPRAVEQWKTVIDFPGQFPNEKAAAKSQLKQITGNWAQFENVELQTDRKAASITLRYRNADKVKFTAREVKFQNLLADVKDYVKSKPKQLDWQKVNIEDIGYRLVQEQQEKYLGQQVAEWETKLSPPDNHFDAQLALETPLIKAGVYLLKASVDEGNSSEVIVWLTDSAIVKKTTDKSNLYYVADAVTGKPVPEASLKFFGYRTQWSANQKLDVSVAEHSARTDGNGLATVNTANVPENYQWIIEAATAEGRYAYLGWSSIWFGRRYNEHYQQDKIYIITDRPVYRPNQEVKVKFWARRAAYELPLDDNSFAGKQLNVKVVDPQGTTVFERSLTSDQFGGVEFSYPLDENAALGQYSIQVSHPGFGGNAGFRVEEYKKPEFEVTVDAPSEPVMLGETIEATISARYYFGEPVADGTVSYKVTRVRHNAHWFPARPWDWFYGRGYWWFAPSYRWYPGFSSWGCLPPLPAWYGSPSEPPEVVAQEEVKLSKDGTYKIKIETALAKELFSDSDHKYEITAEVTDASRRTIVGSGNVFAPRKPFEVFAWVDRGYYRAGDVVEAEFQSQTIAEQPVTGAAVIKLYRIRYAKTGEPTETAVETVEAKVSGQGRVTQKFKLTESGQYRVACTVTDAAGHKIEGGYLFSALPSTGEPAQATAFRYNDLQITTEKAEYRPGEKARLLVASNNPDATILLFLRPAGGVYTTPRLIKFAGRKEAVVEVPVLPSDMPNFYVEVMTIFNGEAYTEVREVVVPPEKRVVDVEVIPSQKEYLPGEKATIQVKLSTGGEPVMGDVALTMYDRAVEYISGGSNVDDIREFFWKWRRSHSPQSETNLNRLFRNLSRPNAVVMQYLGVFGHLVADGDRQRKSGIADESVSEMALDAAAPMAAPMSRSASGSFNAAGGFGGGGIGGGLGGGGMLRGEVAGAKRSMRVSEFQLGVEKPEGAKVELKEATVRSNFADTAYWRATGTANAEGIVELSLTMPENLTDWKIRTWSLAPGTRVGEASASVITRKNLLVRLQAPRFFTETDEVTLSANVHNYLKTDKQARVTLLLEGETLSPLGEPTQNVLIPAGGEVRVDWRVRAAVPGEAKVTMKALTDEESDAMQQTFPVQIHGTLRTESFAGTIKPNGNEGQVQFTIPAERRPADSDVTVRFSPSLAAAMVDALPYLTDYPYGCAEQTLNRFLPTVITQNVLRQMKIDLRAIQEKRTNLNAQEIGDPAKRAADWGRRPRHWQADKNPVFDEAEVQKQAQAGLDRLVNMQLDDGGWGWFPGGGSASAHITALVVHGLKTAQDAGTKLPEGVYNRGVDWLLKHQQQQVKELANYEQNEEREKQPHDKELVRTVPEKSLADNLDAFIFMVLTEAGRSDGKMEAYLYRDRTRLSAYALAMYGIALHEGADPQAGAGPQATDEGQPARDPAPADSYVKTSKEHLAMVLRNLSQFLVEDNENQTAYLRLENGNSWWYWYGSEIEGNAYYLKLLALTNPQSDVSPKLVKYLLNNRKHSTYWNSTRDTAIVIEAMATYLNSSRELDSELAIEVLYDGVKKKVVKVNRSNLFEFDNTFVLRGEEVDTGNHTVTLRKTGKGPLYWNAYVTTFNKQANIPAAGLEVKVRRTLSKLSLQEEAKATVRGSRGQTVEQKVEKYDRQLLKTGDTLTSGDLVEVELIIDSKNDYEYLAFEDMKAAGFEPVDVRSGYSGNSLGAYMELRDEKVAFFVERLPRGTHNIKYRLRAEIPGSFSALPTKAYAMYAPELRGNSNEIKLTINDRDN